VCKGLAIPKIGWEKLVNTEDNLEYVGQESLKAADPVKKRSYHAKTTGRLMGNLW